VLPEFSLKYARQKTVRGHMGSLRGLNNPRYKKEFPQTNGIEYCYDVLVMRTFNQDGLGWLSFQLGNRIGFISNKHELLEIINLKILPDSVHKILRDHLDLGDMPNFWLLDKEDCPHVFSGIRVDPESVTEDEVEAIRSKVDMTDTRLYLFPEYLTFTVTVDFDEKIGLYTVVRSPEEPQFPVYPLGV
jgi:hypothetical protein